MKSRFSGPCDVMRVKSSPLFEIARVFVRFDHVASFHLDESRIVGALLLTVVD
jgi:hypothetical protein